MKFSKLGLFSFGLPQLFDKSNIDDFHRKNGLQLPLDSHQILAWFLTAAPIICYFTFIFPCFIRQEKVLYTAPFTLFYIVGVGLFVFCTLDTHQIPLYISNVQTHYCRYCHERTPNEAKHCRQCNKCRVGFDHHCRYINNCVSFTNYKQFYFGICCFITAAIISLVATGNVIYRYTQNQNLYYQLLHSYLKLSFNQIGFWVIIGITIAVDFGLLIPLSVLMGYHIFFQTNNVTTYDYILSAVENFPEKMERFSCCVKSNKIFSAPRTH